MNDNNPQRSQQAPNPNPERSVVDAVVVGAGISGLVAAYRLRQRGLTVQVVDASDHDGGVMHSVRRDGCLYECGPNSALDTTPLIGELVAELGLTGQLRYASEVSNKRYILHRGVPVALPMSPGGFLKTPLFSAGAKLALMREPFVAAGDPAVEESIAAFVRRRLGSEFLDYAIDPFVAGVYAGDPEQISVQAAFPKLHAMEQRWGSLIRGQILGAKERRQAKEKAKNSAKSFSFADGMQVLPDALAAAVGGVAHAARVQRCTRDGDGLYTVRASQRGAAAEWRARAVVLALPADACALLLREQAPGAAAALDAIAYAPVATVASAYSRAAVAHALDGFGVLVPRKERRRVLGVLFSSSMFDGRAPAGTVLLTTFIGGLRNADLAALPEDDLARIAHDEHAALLGASGQPLFQAVTRWPRAIPQYTIGHLQRIERVMAAARELPGLHLCANWRGGVSVGDCIRSGHAQGVATAEALLAAAG